MIHGPYSCVVPPIIYAMMGTCVPSRACLVECTGMWHLRSRAESRVGIAFGSSKSCSTQHRHTHAGLSIICLSPDSLVSGQPTRSRAFGTRNHALDTPRRLRTARRHCTSPRRPDPWLRRHWRPRGAAHGEGRGGHPAHRGAQRRRHGHQRYSTLTGAECHKPGPCNGLGRATSKRFRYGQRRPTTRKFMLCLRQMSR